MDNSYSDLSKDLHTLLTAPTHAVRDRVAAIAASYIRSFLVSRHSRWRFGFQEPFPLVAQSVADTEVAQLLQMEPVPGGFRMRTLRAHFVNALRSARVGPKGSETGLRRDRAEPADVLVESTDLESPFREILRTRALQGCHLLWKVEHPHEARLLRSLKRNASRGNHLRIVRDARGQFLVTPASDLSRLRIPVEDLDRCMGRVGRWDAAGILLELMPLLQATEEHGGYCFLLDVVRSACAARYRLLGEIATEGRTRGMESVDASGIPVELLHRRLYTALEERARGILARRNGGIDAAVREAWVAVAVDMMLRKHGFGVAELDGLTMHGALRRRLGSCWSEQQAAAHVEGTRDLLRRLRESWNARPGPV